jgi:hypothetical protein
MMPSPEPQKGEAAEIGLDAPLIQSLSSQKDTRSLDTGHPNAPEDVSRTPIGLNDDDDYCTHEEADQYPSNYGICSCQRDIDNALFDALMAYVPPRFSQDP